MHQIQIPKCPNKPLNTASRLIGHDIVLINYVSYDLFTGSALIQTLPNDCGRRVHLKILLRVQVDQNPVPAIEFGEHNIVTRSY